MPKPKWQEPLEQWGGHFLLLGICLTLLIGPLSVVIYLVQEFSPWRWLPWPLKGQWPAGDTLWIRSLRGMVVWSDDPKEAIEKKPYQPLDRLIDQRRDLIFKFSGFVLAEIAREVFFIIN